MRFPSLALLLLLSLGLACDRGPVAPDARPEFVLTESDAMYQLVGKALFPGEVVGAPRDLVVVIMAVQSFDGRVRGYVISPFERLRLPVIGLTPPSAEYDYWCLQVPHIEGMVHRAYVRDNDPEMDEINWGTSASPAGTCTDNPEPNWTWVPMVAGDFRGTVRNP